MTDVPLAPILERRLLLVSGKGGVGKTTIAAALGMLAARQDLEVLLVEVEGRDALGSMFGAPPLTSEPVELSPGLHAMSISPEEVLREYFEVQFHLKRLARPVLTSQLVYYVTHAAPGLRDILLLGKMWYEGAKRQSFDLIILDTPAAGHTVAMLGSPEGFLHAVPFGPLASNVRKVLEWLRDPEEVAVHLVTTPEEMPVNETIETTSALEKVHGLDVAGIFVNMLLPPIAEDPALAQRLESLESPEQLRSGAPSLSISRARALFECASFYNARRALQQEHYGELRDSLAHTALLIDLPFLFRPGFGPKELELLADAIEEQGAR